MEHGFRPLWEGSSIRGDQKVRVLKIADDEWVVVAIDHQPIAVCPCCGNKIRSIRAAQELADRLYPHR